MNINRITQRFSNTVVVVLLTILAIFGLITSGFAHIQSGDDNWWRWLDGASQNFSTELIGAVLTFVLIEVLVGLREKHHGLVERLRSGDTSVLNILNDNNMTVSEIDLSRVLWRNINLQGAILRGASLQGAFLQGADLRAADLRGADLQGAFLRGADMRAANLQGVSLLGANLRATKFNPATTLPDGAKWTEQANMRRFTDAGYANFWQAAKDI